MQEQSDTRNIFANISTAIENNFGQILDIYKARKKGESSMPHEPACLGQELSLYKQQQSRLVKLYANRIIALKDGLVLGDYDSKIDALDDMKEKKIAPGTFLIIKCTPDDSEYTRRFRSRVLTPHAVCGSMQQMEKQGCNVTVHAMFSFCETGLASELTSNIAIGVAFKYDENMDIPKPFPKELVAVWDTGATGTSITQALADILELDEIGTVEIRGVTGSCCCKKYLVSLHLPNGVVIQEIEVASLDGDIGCDVLIGMDVINKGDFAVSNFNGNTTFTFRMPSIECLDFTGNVT